MAFSKEQLAKLKSLESGQNSSKMSFNQLRCVYLDAPKKAHYPKLSDGSRGKESDGISCTFSELGSSRKITVVVPQDVNLDLMGVYIISGLGYDIRSANLVFIDEAGKVQALNL